MSVKFGKAKKSIISATSFGEHLQIFRTCQNRTAIHNELALTMTTDL